MALLFNAIRLALSAIARNTTRSALTVLGILIGVAAVVTVTGLATAASDLVGGQIDSFASNAIYISAQPSQQKGVKRASARLTDMDGRAIAREAVSVTDVASFSSTQGPVVYGDRNVVTDIVGTQLPYYKIRKYAVARGSTWTPSDELLKTKVCVVGSTVADKLFAGEDPVGKTIRVGHAPYRVLGVLEKKGASPFGDDQDDRIMMPIGSYRARVVHTWQQRADLVMGSATSVDTTEGAMRQITSILRQRHRIPDGMENDFRVSSQAQFRAAEEGIATALSALLMGVAAISLLVGGVGVMNIMLVSVSERTREIGIRMSIGAREGDIRLQFLVEAVVLSTVGGIAGVVVGMVSAFGLGFVLDWRVVPRMDALVVALTTSAVIGVVFGFLPARRAARMDPIDALRTE